MGKSPVLASPANASSEKSSSDNRIRLRASATTLLSPLMYVSFGPNSSSYDEAPSHDTLCVESLVDQILVVCKDFNLVAQEDISIFLERFHYAETLSLSGGVSSLSWVQLATVEGYRPSLLGYHCPQLKMTGVRVYLER